MFNKTISTLAILLLISSSTSASLLMASGANKPSPGMPGVAGKAAGMSKKTVGMDKKININTASIESLSKIPGLDPKIAEAISAYREANGAFKSVSDLVNIEGIDAGLLNKIEPLLSI